MNKIVWLKDMPTNILTHLYQNKDITFKSCSKKIKQPIITYGVNNKQDGQIWPNNPYQYIFADKVVSHAMLCGLKSVISPFYTIPYRVRNKKHTDDDINKNYIIRPNQSNEEYELQIKKINVVDVVRFFVIKDKIFIQQNTKKTNDLDNSYAEAIVHEIKNKTTLDLFSLDVVWDGNRYYIDDINVFPFPDIHHDNISSAIASFIISKVKT